MTALDLVDVFGTYLREYHGYEQGDDTREGEAEFIVECLKRDGFAVTVCDCLANYGIGTRSPFVCPHCGRRWAVRDRHWVPWA